MLHALVVLKFGLSLSLGLGDTKNLVSVMMLCAFRGVKFDVVYPMTELCMDNITLANSVCHAA